MERRLEEINNWDEIPEFSNEDDEDEFWSSHALGAALLERDACKSGIPPALDTDIEAKGIETSHPLYNYAESDRIACVSRGTSKRWLEGYKYPYFEDEHFQPPITIGSGHETGVSFVDLIEVVVADRLRQEGFGLKKIRRINEFCQKWLKSARPLVTETFKFQGRDIFVQIGEGHLLNVGRQRGMHAWSAVLDPFLETLDYDEHLVSRWWPLGRNEPIVVDPDYGFGLPVIAGTGVRTESVAERKRAGGTLEDIAYDFDLDPSQVKAALRYEFPEAA